MLDHVAVVSNGGVVLWEYAPEGGSPSASACSRRQAIVNDTIQEVLLEDRAAEAERTVGEFKVHWSLANSAHFFVVGIFHKFLQLLFIDQFLQDVSAAFSKMYAPSNEPLGIETVLRGSFADFQSVFMELLGSLERSERGAAGSSASKQVVEGGGGSGDDGDGSPVAFDSPDQADELAGTTKSSSSQTFSKKGSFVTTSGKRIVKKGSGGGAPAAPAGSPTGKKPPTGGRGPKEQRNWNGLQTGPSVDPDVDKGTEKPSDADMDKFIESQRKTYIRRDADGSVTKIEEKQWDKPAPRGVISSWLRSHFGAARELDEEDFAKVIPKLREKLIGKNVAVEVADDVCKSVEKTMAATKLGTFDSLQGAVEKAMIEALRRIMRPKREINILREVAASRSKGRPYSIVLCGVNGVGKSTSLAKLTYWLQQSGYSVLIAAGDTFRGGAVEQLEVHGRCLNTPVFQMGYAVDPSAVAKGAIAQATKTNADVVIIDTAGRMQDHESRMRALAKLIHDNQPGLVLFVGEAIVGNNGIDQLRKFNQCLHDFTPIGCPVRGIDGLILTKFDTIDDKVGAAVSMVYELGQPIVFVGVGQTYQDLKVIEEDVVVSALMA